MARTELDRSVLGSLFDRLTDENPQTQDAASVSREESTRHFRRSVKRDLEHLLNTRRTIVKVDGRYHEVRQSVHEYGVPDTTGVSMASQDGPDRLTADLKDAIARFEPRLINVNIVLTESSQITAPQVRFKVEATLRMDPTPEQVLFDTVLEVASNSFAVDDSA